MKRVTIFLLILSLAFGITACGSDSGDSGMVEEINQDINIEDNDSLKEIGEEPDRDEVIKSIEYNIGEDDELVDVSVDGNDIFVKIKLDDNGLISSKDLALSRYSSITDELLDNEYWENIAVEFVDIGIIEMNSSQAKTNEYGRYFDSLEMEEKLQTKVIVNESTGEDELSFKKECESNAKDYPAGPGKILYTKGDNHFTGMKYYFKGEIVKIDTIDNSVGDPSVWLVKNDAGYVMPIQHEYFIADVSDVVEVWGTLSGNGYERVDGIDNVVGITGSMHAMQVTVNGEEQY